MHESLYKPPQILPTRSTKPSKRSQEGSNTGRVLFDNNALEGIYNVFDESVSLNARESQYVPEAIPSPCFNAIQQWAATNFIPNLVNDLPERFSDPHYDVCLSDFGPENDAEASFGGKVDLDEEVDDRHKGENENKYEPDDDDDSKPFRVIQERFTYTDGSRDRVNHSQNEDSLKPHHFSDSAGSVLRYYEDNDSAALPFLLVIQPSPVADGMHDQWVDASESILPWIAGVAPAFEGEEDEGESRDKEEYEEGWREDFLGTYEASVRSEECKSASSSLSSDDAPSDSEMGEEEEAECAVQRMSDSILSWKKVWLYEGYGGVWEE